MKNKHHLLSSWLLVAALWPASSLIADETEIYFTDKSGEVAPNVLFVIDASGSMRQVVTGDATSRTRLQVLKDSFQEVMNTAPANLNVGLMHYANHGLGNDYWWSAIKGVNFPISPIDAPVKPLIDTYQAADNLPNPATSTTVVREFMASIVSSWSANGYTPIVDSLYEAARYFRGETVKWGMDVPRIGWAAHPLTYDNAPTCTASHQAECVKSWGQCNTNIVAGSCSSTSHNECCNWITTGGDGSGYCQDDNYTCSNVIEKCKHTVCDAVEGAPVYKSPMQYSCQANYLVLMSDGKPEYPYFPGLGDVDGTHYYPPSVKNLAIGDFKPMPLGWGTYFNSLIATNNTQIKAAPRLQDYLGAAANNCGTTAPAPRGYNSGRCGVELTRWLADTDHNTTLTGKQGVETYTVAFALADEPKGTAYLKDLATKADGAFTANNATELAGAFKAILSAISKASSSFSSPTYSIDTSSMLAHSDEVYIPMFDRSSTAIWAGNLKKFARTLDGKIVGGTLLRDANNRVTGGDPVVNDKGEFLDTADDLWGPVSGLDVAGGGAASQLPVPDSRKLYTDVSTDSALTADANNLTESNTNITSTMLVSGSITAAERTKLLNFVRGKNPDSTVRQHMGDMLNSKPLVVDYGADGKRIFAATNEGFLHSINTENGKEQWAFMPKILLPNIKTFMENLPTKNHVYGIDGPLTLWNYDNNLDGKLKATDGDKRVLFFGLRRGGKAYYALDITNPDSPLILWKKDNTLTIDSNAWHELGETWSKPSLAKMRIGSATSNQVRDVLVFGAGYDASKDVETNRQADQLGSDVMIVDALTGELYWSLQRNVYGGNATTNPVKHSVPGDIRVLDMDRNGTLDRLYFADTGGNVWRVDMDRDLRDSDPDMYNYDDAVLTKMAELGENGEHGTDTRKFFYEPDTALIQHNGKVHMTISLGSGYRTHPLNTKTEDRFYVLMEPNVYNDPPSGFVALKNADLVNAKTGFTNPNDNLLNGTHKGWYYDFAHQGEKVLAPAVTFLNKVVFTTFAPVDKTGQGAATADPCIVPPNSARAYVLDLFTGKAVANLDRDTGGSKDDFMVAGFNEILDAAKVIFRMPSAAEGGDCTVGDCQQTVEIRVGKLEMPILDASNDVDGVGIGGVTGSVDLTNVLPRMFWLDHNVID